MTSADEIFSIYAQTYDQQRQHEMTLRQYLEGCREDPMLYATAAERMMKAIGEPNYIDTSKDPRLGRIFLNRTIKVYPAFKDFFGLEETIEGSWDFSAMRLKAWKSASRFSICSDRSEAASPPLPNGSRN